MKRKSIACHLVRLLFLVLIVVLLPVSVWAQETTLTADVPSVHTLHIELTGKGRIIVDDIPYEKSVNLQIQRHSTPVISVEADNGSKIKSVFLGGQDFTEEFQSGEFTFPEICDDVKLVVVFETQSGTPQTGDKLGVEMPWLMLLSAIGMVLCVMTHRKPRTNGK